MEFPERLKRWGGSPRGTEPARAGCPFERGWKVGEDLLASGFMAHGWRKAVPLAILLGVEGFHPSPARAERETLLCGSRVRGFVVSGAPTEYSLALDRPSALRVSGTPFDVGVELRLFLVGANGVTADSPLFSVRGALLDQWPVPAEAFAVLPTGGVRLEVHAEHGEGSYEIETECFPFETAEDLSSDSLSIEGTLTETEPTGDWYSIVLPVESFLTIKGFSSEGPVGVRLERLDRPGMAPRESVSGSPVGPASLSGVFGPGIYRLVVRDIGVELPADYGLTLTLSRGDSIVRLFDLSARWGNAVLGETLTADQLLESLEEP